MATSYYKLDIEIRESVGKKSTKAIAKKRSGKIVNILKCKVYLTFGKVNL